MNKNNNNNVNTINNIWKNFIFNLSIGLSIVAIIGFIYLTFNFVTDEIIIENLTIDDIFYGFVLIVVLTMIGSIFLNYLFIITDITITKLNFNFKNLFFSIVLGISIYYSINYLEIYFYENNLNQTMYFSILFGIFLLPLIGSIIKTIYLYNEKIKNNKKFILDKLEEYIKDKFIILSIDDNHISIKTYIEKRHKNNRKNYNFKINGNFDNVEKTLNELNGLKKEFIILKNENEKEK